MHPVEANKYLVATKPIEEYANWCVAAIEAGMPGKAMTANYRVGKTYADRWIVRNRKALLKEDVPMYVLPQRFYTASTAKKFFSHILQASGHSLYSGDESALRTRSLMHFAEITSHMEHKRVVLFIDEAQWLGRHTYNLLINLANELSEADIRLIVFSVGSPELDDTIKRYRTLKRGHIVGRFMSSTFHMRGIESSEHLSHAWMQYDAKSFFPEGSNISYTRAFAGDRFSDGLTLAKLAPDAWTAMDSMFRNAGGKGLLSVPMQTVTLVANALLLRVAGDLDPPYVVAHEVWFNMLDDAGFLDHANSFVTDD